MEEKLSKPKWEAKVSAKLTKASPEQIWALLRDFFNLHKWFPNLPTCYGIHGANGSVGCIRYCAGFSLPNKEGGYDVSWSKERLIAVDPNDKSLTYEIVDCNIGFTSYVSTVKVVPCDHGGGGGCVIEWWITVDPVEGWRKEDLVKKYEDGLVEMAKKMEGYCTGFDLTYKQ